MSGYTSILSCISTDQKSQNDIVSSPSDANDDLSEQDAKEINEIVEDLLTIQNKDVLKRNLTSLVTENVSLKKKCKLLEEKLSQSKDQSGIKYSFLNVHLIKSRRLIGQLLLLPSSDWSIHINTASLLLRVHIPNRL